MGQGFLTSLKTCSGADFVNFFRTLVRATNGRLRRLRDPRDKKISLSAYFLLVAIIIISVDTDVTIEAIEALLLVSVVSSVITTFPVARQTIKRIVTTTVTMRSTTRSAMRILITTSSFLSVIISIVSLMISFIVLSFLSLPCDYIIAPD